MKNIDKTHVMQNQPFKNFTNIKLFPDRFFQLEHYIYTSFITLIQRINFVAIRNICVSSLNMNTIRCY